MLNKRNINSVCLSRKDLLSDKVSTKGPPDFENLDHSPHQLCPRPPLPVLVHTDNVYVHIPCMHTDSHTHARTHIRKKKKKKKKTEKKNYSNPISIKCISSV